MEEEQIHAPLEQQSVNSTQERESRSSSSSGGSGSNTGGTAGDDPNARARHFQHLSNTSIQAKEGAHWQAIANNSPQVQQTATIQAAAERKAAAEHPQNTQQETGIPLNLQASIEHQANISLKEVRVHYDASKAEEAGVATLNEYPNIYVAPGKKKQLGDALWEVARNLQQQQSQTNPKQESGETINIPALDTAPAPTVESAPVESDSNTDTILEEAIVPSNELLLEEGKEEQKTDINLESTNDTGGSDDNSEEPNPSTSAFTFNNEKPEKITPKPLHKPHQDSGYRAVKKNITTEGDKQQKHHSSNHALNQVHKAAAEPSNRKTSLAQGKQLGVIQKGETPAFETNAFVNALMAKVKDIMPKNQEEAENFNKNAKVKEVKRSVTGTVSAAKKDSLAPMQEVTQQAPNPAAIPNKKITPLPSADLGKAPKDIQAKRSIPARLREDRVEKPLQENAARTNEMMAKNDMSDEQLEQFNNPQFLAVLEEKKGLEQQGEEKAQQIRAEEDRHRDVNKQDVEQLGGKNMSAMHQHRKSAMTKVHSQQQSMVPQFTAEEQVVADKIGEIYKTTKQAVEKKLDSLQKRVQQEFDEKSNACQRAFESHVAARLSAYKKKRYEGAVVGTLKGVKDYWVGLPDEVNAFFVEGRNKYVQQMRRVIQDIAKLVARELNSAKKLVQQGRQEVADYVENLPKHLRKAGSKAAADINSKFDQLDSKVDQKQKSLINTLAKKYTENIKKVDDYATKIKQEHEGLWDAFESQLKGPFEEIQKVKAMLMGALSAAGDAIQSILMNPIGFLSNMIGGVKQGFDNFVGGIETNLKTGFVEWLTGSLGNKGITMPENVFSLEGIWSITTQALNLTWENIRKMAVAKLGERKVEVIEDGFEVFSIMKEKGFAGVWEYVKEEFANLKAEVMDSITGMLITEVIKAGISTVLAMLTPAGAFMKAALSIVKIVQFFINQGSQVVELVNAITQSIGAMAKGDMGQVAKAVEGALKRSVPVLIGFLAALANVSGLAKKVQGIFEKIRGKITKTIEGFIEKGKKWFKGGGRKQAKKKKKEEKGKAKDADKKEKEEDKNKKDKRTDKEKKKAVDQGLQQGVAVVNRKGVNIDEIKTALKKVEKKHQLTDLEAKLLQQEEKWHTFVLESKLGKYKKEKQIKRTPTKADKESHVSAADRALHKRLAAEIKQKLQESGKSTKKVENFEAFYDIIKKEAAKLQQEYQPQLRDGIKVAVELMNAVAKDKEDRDVDVRVRIAPNAHENEFKISYDNLINRRRSEEDTQEKQENINKLATALKKEFNKQYVIRSNDIKNAIKRFVKGGPKDSSKLLLPKLWNKNTKPLLYKVNNSPTRLSFLQEDDLNNEFIRILNQQFGKEIFLTKDLKPILEDHYKLSNKQKDFRDQYKKLIAKRLLYKNDTQNEDKKSVSTGQSVRFCLEPIDSAEKKSPEEKAKDYNKMILGLKLNGKEIAPWQQSDKHTITEASIKTCRDNLKKSALETYGSDINSLNKHVLQNENLVLYQKIRGDIFEMWLNQRGSSQTTYAEKPIFFRKDYSNLLKPSRIADGYSTNEKDSGEIEYKLCEAKATKDTAGTIPSKEQVKQFNDYVNLAKAKAQWRNKNGAIISFGKVIYEFNNESTKNIWSKKLTQKTNKDFVEWRIP